ncbi:GGDEF domain-containing protein [Aquibium oceanicum]|uniref:diguanylate cyclase n=1 Tax=Aquibium oceanicum TaxID=1670800 RepID=A0A1L3SVC0_9HYPH|nr:GGDEF domain-containing protein [Aquibium oceanicum]APH73272.1 hypothetical protein BSQ44_19265 [Aquibium oceanicum]
MSGTYKLDTFTLFAANAVCMVIMAAAFLFAGRDGHGQRYWKSWASANLVIACAILLYMFAESMLQSVFAAVPNSLLLAGFGLRWQASREFGRRHPAKLVVWGPALLIFAICMTAPLIGSRSLVYTSTNLLLTVLAIATAWEFWRDRADSLPSRYGLTGAYVFMAASFGVRTIQGFVSGETLSDYFPDDILLTTHLMLGLVYTCASGAFALSIAYERNSAKLRVSAMYDALTNLLNRGAFEELARQKLASSATSAIVVLDIDHFKQINDRYGHAAGDEALRQCAALCREAAENHHLVGRIGGEEFAIFMPDAGQEDAALLAERLRMAVDASIFRYGDRVLRLTVSLGYSWREASGDEYEKLMREADAALYRAKDAGRNRVERRIA